MQRTHVVKGVQKQLNDEVELVSLQDGAYRPIKPTVATILTRVTELAYSQVCLNSNLHPHYSYVH